MVRNNFNHKGAGVCSIGLDITKQFFQLHGVDKHGKDIFNKKLWRNQVLSFFANLPACVVGPEACGEAHYWIHEISELEGGPDTTVANI